MLHQYTAYYHEREKEVLQGSLCIIAQSRGRKRNKKNAKDGGNDIMIVQQTDLDHSKRSVFLEENYTLAERRDHPAAALALTL
jgi:hypothetical protein